MILILVLGAAVCVVVCALKAIDREHAESAARLREAAADIAPLAQVAESPAHMTKLVQEARDIHARGTTATLGEAARLLLAFERARISQDDRKLLVDLQGIVPDVGRLAAVLRTYVEAAGGEERAGTIHEVLEKGFAAAKMSGQPVTDILAAAGRAQSMGRAAGWSPDEVLAATTTLARRTGSAEEAGDQIEAFAYFVIGRPQLQGLSPSQAIEKIEKEVPPERLHQFFADDR